MKKMKPIFKGKLLTVGTIRKHLPNGYRAYFEVVKHPGAALVVPFLSKDKIIMIRQLRPVIDSYLYELPAGTLSINEDPLACARREIVEETGYAAKVFKRLGAIYTVPGYSTERIVIYKAEKLTKKRWMPEEDEVIEHFAVTKPMVKRLFRSGKIVDAKTICALSMCGWL